MSSFEHDPFVRKVVDGSMNRLIESRCARCGFRIVGSLRDGLKEDEDKHAATCPKKNIEGTTAQRI